ncbi:SigB/SigF/SigG family RNA polymerase sigma factor [Streptomyces sp. VRA16 Mangrove soil]|uniref:SigB/SigF/SigG family RNA polymerase sigma factor n=1 Tax=Streptomyces sp. VRA16 Mangrove soil TaxID=2817434 RepID=UPI001A9E720E|nr:SigB/SigF/SigG family RNA polymerase sigma factor [Streptomyces sp. VRA16 Mangrove soil]MBO1330293.1 SigB/SigF/SigG family RNA polymerase sigma factor [Streptomyces sp. VRA16 Mangrove soil]
MVTHRVHDDAPHTEETFERLAVSSQGPEHDVLREELVEAWLPMAHRLARRFRDKGESVEDLEQVAAVGLVKAVDRYDPGRGAFEPYAVPTITGELRRHFRDHAWDLRVPRRIKDLRNKARFARRDLMNRPDHPDREPSTQEIAQEAGLSCDEVREGMEALESYRSLSLDAEVGAAEQGYSLSDTLGETEPAYDLVADREAAKEGLAHLPERERVILYLRFFEDMTQARIGEELGISQMHVSRLIARSCATIRDDADPQAGRDRAA